MDNEPPAHKYYFGQWNGEEFTWSGLKYLHISKKIIKFVNTFFLVKKGSSGKNLDIILLAYSRRAQNFLFCWSGRELWPFVYVMSILLHAINLSSQIPSLYMVKEGDAGKNLQSNRCPYTMVQVTTPCDIPFIRYLHFCKRL